MTTDAARSAAVAAAHTLALGVRDLAERVNPAVLPGIAVTKSLRTRILFDVWSRMVLWMRSVGRLNNTEDFQAILAGNRALFELLIDMVLLHREATEDAAMRYWQWANSERMRLYETVARYYEERALPVPAMYRSGEAEQGELRLLYARIRREHWPDRGGRHPARWTGRGTLLEDARHADELFGTEVTAVLGVGLTEFYASEYRMLSWHVHGGIAGTDDLTWRHIESLVGRGLNSCSAIAMLGTQIILREEMAGEEGPLLTRQWLAVWARRDAILSAARRQYGLAE